MIAAFALLCSLCLIGFGVRTLLAVPTVEGRATAGALIGFGIAGIGMAALVRLA